MPSHKVVLCIDDNIAGLMTRKLLLEAKGFQVFTAASGAAGIAVAQREPIDVVILDYKMPDMDGEEVAKNLRREHPGVPILLLSGYPEDLPQSLVQLVDHVFIKGDPLNALLSELDRVTGSTAKPSIDQPSTRDRTQKAMSRAQKLLSDAEEMRRKFDQRRKA